MCNKIWLTKRGYLWNVLLLLINLIFIYDRESNDSVTETDSMKSIDTAFLEESMCQKDDDTASDYGSMISDFSIPELQMSEEMTSTIGYIKLCLK